MYKPVIGKFDVKRLIFWDEETERKFKTFCEFIKVKPTEDE